MSSIGSPNPFFIAGKKAYEVERSLRFNSADATMLQRTLSSSGNRRTFTWSGWVKRAKPDSSSMEALFASTTEVSSGNSNTYMTFYQDKIYLNSYDYSGGGTAYSLTTTQVFRDPSAWYHIVWAVDTTQSTSSNRIKLYINGEQVTSFSTASYPSQNYQGLINNSSYKMTMGRAFPSLSNNSPLNGYMAEINFIDGFQYDPSYFGETNVITGQWNPKKYTGSYGTNGFYLNFSDNSGTTASTLGKDSSGNGNNFTPNNFSVGAGIGNDSLEDTPTNNFCTLNPLKTFGTYTLSNGNLTVSGSARFDSVGTFAVSSGKWFWEITNTDVGIAYNGILNINQFRTAPGAIGSGGVYTQYVYDGTKYRDANPSGASAYGASYTDGDIVGVALNLDDNEITFYKNGTSQGAITIPNDLYTAYLYSDSGSYNYSINFGQRAFSYTAPTGYKALNSANLPDPTILLPNKHFDTLLYTGNSTDNRAITGLNFQPDLTWIKRRSGGAQSHFWVDALRSNTDGSGGNGNVGALATNDTYAETATLSDGGFESFNSDGFTLGKGSATHNADAPYQRNNASGGTYCAWNWNAGDTDGKTYTVTVVSDSGNKYRFDGYGTSAVTLDLAEGGTYIFNYPSAHPFRFSTTSDGTHGGGSEYTTGVTVISSTSIQIVVAASAPTLYYYCSSHSGMGGAINTNSTLGSSNFDGTTQSVTKVNASAGFSIVTYTGTGSTTTVGHGLGVAPKVVLTKSRSSSGSWGVLHTESNPTAEHRINLNDNGGFSSYQGYNIWADTVPTSSVFTVNSDATTNASSVTYVGYLFNEVAGYSKFGKYTGNGDANGPFIFTGFRPAWIMIKNVNTSTWWFIYDVKRETFNPQRTIFGANVADAEYPDNAYRIDILSNGFKIRGTQNETNKSGDTISYFSFAESPFKNARAR